MQQIKTIHEEPEISDFEHELVSKLILWLVWK